MIIALTLWFAVLSIIFTSLDTDVCPSTYVSETIGVLPYDEVFIFPYMVTVHDVMSTRKFINTTQFIRSVVLCNKVKTF